MDHRRVSASSASRPSTKAPSVASLRAASRQHAPAQPQAPQPSGSGPAHARRASADGSQPSASPITYFPNPSSFTSSPNPAYMPVLSTSPGAAAAPHARPRQSTSGASVTGAAPYASSAASVSASVSASTSEGETDAEDDRGQRTPRVGHGFDVGSPRGAGAAGAAGAAGPSAAPASAPRRRASGMGAVHGGRAQTMASYGATEGLGFGSHLEARRVASSAGGLGGAAPPPPITAPGRHEPSPAGHGGHGAYYLSQPPSATSTSRFRERELDRDSRDGRDATPGGPHTSLPFGAPGMQQHGAHAHAHAHHHAPHGHQGHHAHHGRHLSVTSFASALHPPAAPAASPLSPTGTVLRRLRTTASSIGLGLGRAQSYDADDRPADEDDYDEAEDEGRRANGTRVWYSSYVTIDWIHDSVKESSRIRRLRAHARRSLRGKLANGWDRFQGWLVVTVVGVLTALIAFAIIRSEMALFDLKEGFCTTSWGTAKRFCCAPKRGRHDPADEDEEVCGDWVEWGQLLSPHDKRGPRGAWVFGQQEFVPYLLIAVALSTLASALTVYLSSSANHVTSKDSKFLAPITPDPAMSPKTPTERQPLLTQVSASSLADALAEAEPPRPVIFMAAGSGIPEIKTILSGFVIHGYLGMSTLVVKSVGLALSVASGLSLGKEGPFVHIASCVANTVSRLFLKYEQNEAKRREVLSAACAAGVAVSFGAPIGGVLFSLEEVSYYFPPKVMWRSFWCAAVAAIALKALNPYGNGSIVLFEVTYTKEYHYWEYGIFLLLGVFGGLYGALFSRLNIVWSREVRRGTWLNRHPIIEVALVTILTTVVSFMNPYTRLGGTELVAKLFAECHPDTPSSVCVSHPTEIAGVVTTIALALLIKGALTIVTFGIKLPAGIFIPSLVVGACFGRIVGLGMEWLEYTHPAWAMFDVCRDRLCVVPGLYAMVGAAATLAGVTRTTVSLAVIMFELTGTLNYVVPVMLGVLVAKTVADGLEKRGIYELVIELNKLPYLNSKEEYLWGGRRAAEVADRSVPTLRADRTHTVRELTGRLLELVRLGYADAGFPVLVKDAVVDRDGRGGACLRVVGFLGINELEHALTRLSDEPDAIVHLASEDAARPRSSVISIFSFADSLEGGRHNPYDLGRFVDKAPITVQVHSPLELVQQLFVKLGARQVVVTDARGAYKGVVYKKQWLKFLQELEDEQAR